MDEYLKLLTEMEREYNKSFRYISNSEIYSYFVSKGITQNTRFIELIRDYYNSHNVIRYIFNKMLEDIGITKTSGIPDRRQITNLISGYDRFCELMKLKRYSPKTLKNYSGALVQIAGYFHSQCNLSIESVTSADMYKYFLYLTDTRKVSVSSIRIYRFALLFYFREVLHRDIDISFMNGIKKEKGLPQILTRNEVLDIRINQGKGKKDRVKISPEILFTHPATFENHVSG